MLSLYRNLDQNQYYWYLAPQPSPSDTIFNHNTRAEPLLVSSQNQIASQATFPLHKGKPEPRKRFAYAKIMSDPASC